MTLLVYNTLTALVLFEEGGLDKERFDIQKTAVTANESGSDDDSNEDVEQILEQATSGGIALIDKKMGSKRIEKGDALGAKITKMSIT